MKKLYFLFFLTIGFLSNAQIVNIPDANFKAKLLQSSSSNYIAKNLSGIYFKIDANNDGQIQNNEAINVRELYLSSSSINSLTGIGNFTNLIKLNINLNNIQNLDFEALPNLSWVDCITNNAININWAKISKMNVMLYNYSKITSQNLYILQFQIIRSSRKNT